MTFEGGLRNGPMMDTDEARIMIVAESGALYQSLARTLEEQLHGCHALICQAGSAAASAGGGVQLILVHASCCTGVAREIEAQRALHPTAAIAVLIDSMEVLTPHCCELFAMQKVQGILPMTLRLEVWLAAVLLLLSGGEYYPAPNRRDIAPDRTQPPVPAAPSVAAAAGFATSVPTPLPPLAAPTPAAMPATAAPQDAAAVSPAITSLTAREREILELLSEGHQNKLIAHKMSLSEHTVKVHVHNLLSKLRVSNRTQAAARYRKGMSGGYGAAAALGTLDANGAGAAY